MVTEEVREVTVMDSYTAFQFAHCPEVQRALDAVDRIQESMEWER